MDDFRKIVEMANKPFDEIERLQEENACLVSEIAELRRLALIAAENLKTMKIGHRYCEDSWYSCPKAEDGCSDERQGDNCNCGADSFNEKTDKIIHLLEGLVGGNK